MSHELHRGAARDLEEAFRFYRREGGRGLAGRFLDEFERVIALGGGIRVLVVRHQSLDPAHGEWRT